MRQATKTKIHNAEVSELGRRARPKDLVDVCGISGGGSWTMSADGVLAL